MFNKILTTVCVLTVITTVFMYANMAKAQVATAGLVGAWSFDNIVGQTVPDVSGNGNDGTMVGDPQIVRGKFGDALEFDGDDHVELPDMGTVETYPFTLEAWFKTSYTGIQTILAQENTEAGNQRVQLYFGGGGDNFYYNVRNDAEVEIGNQDIDHGEWHHVVGVSAASNDHKLYVDGIEVVTSDTNVTAPSVDSAHIGNWIEGYNFIGTIDEVRIYNRALSAEEVVQNMESPGSSTAVNPTDKLAATWGEIKAK